MKYRHTLLLTLILLPALLIQSCLLWPDEPEYAAPESEEPPQMAEAPPPAASPSATPAARGRFTLRYDPGSTLNPITSRSSVNILLSSLMYESLFVLDGNLNVEPLLCESWAIEGEYTYTLEIKPNIAMSDGSFLTADDVAYTLRQAMRDGLYVNRLRIIDRVESDGELTVTIELNKSNGRFINLLDIPIIKSGSIDSSIPPGTGPYVFSGTQSMRLDSSSRHRDFDRLPVMTIYLVECGDNEAAELFDDGVLSLLWDDPSDPFVIRLNRIPDTFYYETTALQFIGFNMRSVALMDQDVRRAIGYAVNRQYIVENIVPRQAIASPLALSPNYRLYDPAWEVTTVMLNPLEQMPYLLNRAGLEDNNMDSFLEYPDGVGGFIDFSIDFIVNSDNIFKIAIANAIAETLSRNGINITVRELPWEAFENALRSGDFDMYYGEIILSADFDLSPLLLPGSRHNYGGTGNSDYEEYITDFLHARTERGERDAAKRLCDMVTRNAPFVPVVYKRYTIYTLMGSIAGASPSHSGVFRNFADWGVDFTMLS